MNQAGAWWGKAMTLLLLGPKKRSSQKQNIQSSATPCITMNRIPTSCSANFKKKRADLVDVQILKDTVTKILQGTVCLIQPTQTSPRHPTYLSYFGKSFWHVSTCFLKVFNQNLTFTRTHTLPSFLSLGSKSISWIVDTSYCNGWLRTIRNRSSWTIIRKWLISLYNRCGSLPPCLILIKHDITRKCFVIVEAWKGIQLQRNQIRN